MGYSWLHWTWTYWPRWPPLGDCYRYLLRAGRCVWAVFDWIILFLQLRATLSASLKTQQAHEVHAAEFCSPFVFLYFVHWFLSCHWFILARDRYSLSISIVALFFPFIFERSQSFYSWMFFCFVLPPIALDSAPGISALPRYCLKFSFLLRW